jgi:phage-related protein
MSEFIDSMADFVDSVTGNSGSSISNILSSISGLVSSISPLSGHVTDAVDAIKKLVDGGGLDLNTIIELIGKISTAFEGIIKIVKNVIGYFTSLFNSIFGGKKSGSGGATNTSLSGGGNSDSGSSGIFSKVGGFILSAVKNIGGFFSSVFDSIGNFFSGSTKSDSGESLELKNSSNSSSTGSGNEPTIIDPRNVDITINVNTEKADKDFVDRLTEELKKSFLDGLLYGQ